MQKTRWVNGVELAAYLKITKGRVSQLEKEGIFHRGLTKKFDLLESVKAYKESKQNIPRVNNGTLPFKASEVEPEASEVEPEGSGVESFKKDAQAAVGAAEQKTTHQQLLIARAASASIAAQIADKKLRVLNEVLVDKRMIYDAVKTAIMKYNVNLKSMILSVPKRLALGWYDPAQRADIEEHSNTIINTILQELSEFDMKILDEAVKP